MNKRNDYFDAGMILYSIGINPESFKKKRHLKKFFKKHLLPILKK